jgi:diguanylate cyclase (GGDEF)-like protein/PAS domain S-box-containing protein
MMPDLASPSAQPELSALKDEILRLNKIIRALMDRAERSTGAQGSDFSRFQTAVMLEEQVAIRTKELEVALRENEKITRALRESELKFFSLVNQSLVGITIIEDGKFSYANVKFNEIFGYCAEEVRGLGVLDIVIACDRPRVAENIQKRLHAESATPKYVFRGLRKNGEAIDVEVHISTMEIGGKPALIGLLMDVTERTRAEHEVQVLQEKLRDQSTHDALTGLYNRRYLEDTLGQELVSAKRHGYQVSVIMSDVDHFKAVNDRYGHLAGDEVLRVFGALLKRHARGSDVYCRYGGEEFLLVLPQMTQDSAVERAEQLRKALVAGPIPSGAFAIEVTASFGVATYPGDGRTGDELIAAADHALYAAKAAGRNRVHVSTTVKSDTPCTGGLEARRTH